MKSRIPVVIALIACTATLGAAGDAVKEKAQLQGTWNATSVVEKGKEEPAEKVRTLKLVIKDDAYAYRIEGTDAVFMATFKLDPTTKPKSIDVTFNDGPLKGKVMQAIYALDGDSLKICGGDKRPTEFKTAADSNVTLFTFKRNK